MPKIPSKLKAALAPKPKVVIPHLSITARAGTGKTTTLTEGLAHLRGDTVGITPSKEQKRIWDCITKSPSDSTVCFCAFGNAIAAELQERVPPDCQAMTIHKMGMLQVFKAYTGIRIETNRTSYLIEKVTGKRIRELRKEEPALFTALKKLVGYAKKNVLDTTTDWTGQMEATVENYGVELGLNNKQTVYDHVHTLVNMSKTPTIDGRIDFDDMVWLPVVNKLDVYKYDMLIVDEAQDLNRCQQQLTLMAGRRLIICGDNLQAIFGFAGADCESLERMTNYLSSSENGCEVAKLTITRRCSKAIVKNAKYIAKDFKAHPTNVEGSVSTINVATYHKIVQSGDMVMCRCNAPLVSECFKFLKRGVKAKIHGRKIGEDLITFIEGMKATTVEDLIIKVGEWLNNSLTAENAKEVPNELRINGFHDKHDCIIAFCEGSKLTLEVVAKIRDVFTDEKKGVGILLTSIHGAKGLEAHNAFLLQYKVARVPHPMAILPWERQQENHLKYVAETRGKVNHYYVEG